VTSNSRAYVNIAVLFKMTYIYTHTHTYMHAYIHTYKSILAKLITVPTDIDITLQYIFSACIGERSSALMTA